jgi:hypothetical protein
VTAQVECRGMLRTGLEHRRAEGEALLNIRCCARLTTRAINAVAACRGYLLRQASPTSARNDSGRRRLARGCGDSFSRLTRAFDLLL